MNNLHELDIPLGAMRLVLVHFPQRRVDSDQVADTSTLPPAFGHTHRRAGGKEQDEHVHNRDIAIAKQTFGNIATRHTQRSERIRHNLVIQTLFMPKKGIILPIMGTPKSPQSTRASHAAQLRDEAGRYPDARAVSPLKSSMADALFTQTQQRVLGLLFGQPQRGFTVSDVITDTGGGSGAVQREVRKLFDAGLIGMTPIGNQKHYQANPASPIHDELVGIVRKTVGLADPLRDALAPLINAITLAFVYGSVAKRSDTAGSDIDLMIVSDKLTYADVVGVLHPVIERLGREINPTVYSRTELAKRRKQGNAFVTRVLEQPKLWLIGNEHDLAAG
ncbi:MAG: nucleotidyltransferase domain-containing protein [Dokdonella sp.]